MGDADVSNEDQVVSDSFLQEFFGPTFRGFACEIGATDGSAYSNTLELERSGWDVLCIEPDPNVQTALRAARKRVIEVACADFISEAELFGNTGASGGGLMENGVMRAASMGYACGSPIKVRVTTLNNCLREVGFTRLDLLVLDVEGWEPEVMQGFAVGYWKPAVLCVENWTGDTPWLRKKLPSSYTFHSRIEAYNDIWISKSRLEQLRVIEESKL